MNYSNININSDTALASDGNNETLSRIPDSAHRLRDGEPGGVRHPPGPLEQVQALGPPGYWPRQSGHREEPGR